MLRSRDIYSCAARKGRGPLRKTGPYPEFLPKSKNTTQEYPKAEEIVIAWFKMQIRALCGENIQNLADAPSFCHTTTHKAQALAPQVGPAKIVSLQDTTTASNVI